MKRIIAIMGAGFILSLGACTSPEVGYISDDIHALEDTISVPRGVFATSATPAAEGSTYPLHWEITEITDAQGNPTDALLETHEIITWKSAFNPDTDTTLALAEAKLELTEEPSILINSVSGELAFTQSTKFVEEDIFKLHVNVSNVKGNRQLDDFVVVKLEEFQPVEFPVEMRSAIQFGREGGVWDMGYTSAITGDYDQAAPSVLDGTHPYISIEKTDEEPSLGIKVRMIIEDSKGTPLDPEKVIFFPDGATYHQNFHDNSTETTMDDISTSFRLPAPPFPQFGRTYTGDNSYLMYYLSTNDAFSIDKEAYEADHGPTDWSVYENPQTGGINNRAYIRWAFKINDSGSWEIRMKVPYTIVNE